MKLDKKEEEDREGLRETGESVGSRSRENTDQIAERRWLANSNWLLQLVTLEIEPFQITKSRM